MTENSDNLNSLRQRLFEIFDRKEIPEKNSFLEKVKKVSEVLDAEDKIYRPQSPDGKPGGLIYLRHIPTIVVPDFHARMDFFLQIMLFNLTIEDKGEDNVLKNLSKGTVQVVCVGDGFHAESRAIDRWHRALEEYKTSFRKHRNMDEEMRESLGLMEMVMELKISFPSLFHFLKGNHENITNENGGGNYPFRKFVYEGEMVTFYINKYYGNNFLMQYSAFEKKLPVLAEGKNFLVSHAEPKSLYTREMVVDYHSYPEVIYGLTWTANDEAEYGSVVNMLKHYLGSRDNGNTFIFGGHRPVRGLYNLRAEDRYVQIHNPEKYIIAWLKNGKINLERDVIEIPYNKKPGHGK